MLILWMFTVTDNDGSVIIERIPFEVSTVADRREIWREEREWAGKREN